jgi:hypothetical protein
MTQAGDKILEQLAAYWQTITVNGIPRDDHLVKIDAKLLRLAAEAHALGQIAAPLTASIPPPKSLPTLEAERAARKGKPIRTDDFISSHRQGIIVDISVKEIDAVLGFKHRYLTPDEGDGKVKHDWRFHVDGVACAIWDYKGSERYGQFSYFGPAQTFKDLFGGKAIDESRR